MTCFDVLEHIPDQHAQLTKLATYLRVGGYLFVNLLHDSTHPNRPMHISSAGDTIALVRRTSLVPDWDATCIDADLNVTALVKRRGGRLYNVAASVVERWQGRSAR
jgi:hypothetical protein